MPMPPRGSTIGVFLAGRAGRYLVVRCRTPPRLGRELLDHPSRNTELQAVARRAGQGATQYGGRFGVSWVRTHTEGSANERLPRRRLRCPKVNRVRTAPTSHPIPRSSVSTCFTCTQRLSRSRTGGIATPWRRRCFGEHHLTRRRLAVRSYAGSSAPWNASRGPGDRALESRSVQALNSGPRPASGRADLQNY